MIHMHFGTSWRKLIWNTIGSLMAAALVAWFGDAAILYFRAKPYDTVQIARFYALNDKFGIDYSLAPPLNQRCVNALFPHDGAAPCWYVLQHKLDFVKVGF